MEGAPGTGEGMGWHPFLNVEDFNLIDVADQARVWDDLPEVWQRQVLRHPHATFEVRWHAIRTNPYWVEVVGHIRDDVPPDSMWDLILHQIEEDGVINGYYVGHPALKEEMLLVLCDLCSPYARETIENHRNAGTLVLERLATDPDEKVLRDRARKKLKAGDELRAIVERLRSWGERKS